MHSNPLWILFFSLMTLGTLIYSGRTALLVWQYLNLDRETTVKDISWSVASLNDDRFFPVGHYEFEVKGKSYQGQTKWNEGYLNEWAAKEAAASLMQNPPSVWYQASKPEISSLQKLFPLKEAIYTLVLWLLGLYYLGLGFYVKDRN